MNAGRPVLLAIVIWGASWVQANDAPPALSPPAASTYDAFSQFASFLDTILKHYSDATNLTLHAHTTASLRSFLRSLDPDADLLTPSEIERPETTVDFGALIAQRESFPTVISVRDGTPAQRAGLLAGERIVAINDEPTTAARINDITRQLDGAADSKLLLRVIDPATGPRNLILQRLTPAILKPTIQYLAPGLGYYRLPEFTFPAVEQFLAELTTATANRMRSLILDLRNNPGGTLDSVVIAAQQFLPPKTPVTTLAYARPGRAAEFVTAEGDPFTGPVLILVNRGTAGEAEVFAGALQDYGRARLIGETTAGYGRHSARFPLPDGAVLVLPTAYFQTPRGRRIHNTGLTPDVPVELAREIEHTLAATGFGQFNGTTAKANTLATDRPLAKALELLSK